MGQLAHVSATHITIAILLLFACLIFHPLHRCRWGCTFVSFCISCCTLHGIHFLVGDRNCQSLSSLNCSINGGQPYITISDSQQPSKSLHPQTPQPWYFSYPYLPSQCCPLLGVLWLTKAIRQSQWMWMWMPWRKLKLHKAGALWVSLSESWLFLNKVFSQTYPHLHQYTN